MASPLSAIIVTHDSAGVLPSCLAALAGQGVPALVVDNASEDETVAIAERAGARVVRNAKNEGFGRANTIGVKAAETEFCLLVNPDLVLQPGAVAMLLAAAERYPDAGMLAPRIVEPDGRVFYQNRSLLSESVLRRPVEGDARAVVPEGDACAPFLSGACLMIRRNLFLELGGFDPEIFLFYEDDDLCRRVLEKGLSLVHVDNAVAHHARGQSSTPRPGRRYRARWHMGWSRVYIARKYGLKSDAMRTILLNAPKALLSALTVQRTEYERYAGIVAGTVAALRGHSALAREGLERP
ncbi:MAG TPA: glycosyltransferase family 2 protein [Beijerinckiaceae bacterium]|nr:glycosyltransferase family 2 protein [Beijerinckiaceae bacterium]